MYAEHKKQEHQARASCAQVPVCPWFPVPTQREKTPRLARHCPQKIQNRHLHQRLLLARTPGMQILCAAKNKHQLLANQNPAEPRTRPRSPHQAPRPRVAHHHPLGMSAQAQNPPHNSRRPRKDPVPDLFDG